MRPVFLSLFLSLHLHVLLVSSISFTEFVFPNFTASNLKFVDSSQGAFLFSRNATFKAGMFSPRGDAPSNFYFSVVHVASDIIIWSANRDSPVSRSGIMNLLPQGISVSEDDKSQTVWSTPVLPSPVFALRLMDSGNLVLLDRFNVSLWESFGFPTDTIVAGQRLPVGMFLSGSVQDGNFSTGDHKFLVGESDALLQWKGQTYWKLRMDTRAYVNMNFPVEYLTITRNGLVLMGRNGTSVIIQVALPPSDFRMAKMDSSGKFIISRLSGQTMVSEFEGPANSCEIPSVCAGIGLCHLENASENPICSCPDELHLDTDESTCVPNDYSLALPVSCDTSNLSYLDIVVGVSYLSNRFVSPAQMGFNLTSCQDLCSRNCSCLGVFYENTSLSCYLVNNAFGSMSLEQNSADNQDLVGYLKLTIKEHSKDRRNDISHNGSGFPLIALVLLPCTGFFLLITLGFLWWRRFAVMRYNSIREKKSFQRGSFSSGDLGSFRIPGLPQKFEYETLERATDNFRTQIGAGGFGSVYKGTLSDNTIVAVKKITNLGVHGRKEFCTEIAIIGNIRHANLVKLRGFCARGRQLLLVYEYMNQGSLDKTLFGAGPVLEWQERFDIALGTARGLAYLHCGCDQKIIHCDVKPENILLHDHFQAKISDFGLSKLLSQEESSLFTTMRGTRGYLAPEWLTNAAISEKADVYSFGMVLLELVSGRKNCSFKSHSHSLMENRQDHRDHSSSSSSSTGLVYFPLYALDMHEQGRYLELADPRLEGRVTNEEIGKVIRIALCCVHEEPALRPTMAAVVGMMEGNIPVGNPRMESLNFLRFYGLRFAEASMVEGQIGESGDLVFRRESSNSGGSRNSLSYVASQQVSGPR
ncbi:PREDICTED: G-type lectin S-receptor-like serine/threonine-protein kinase At5g35370 [Tarenaya hassleriana]|uniref:G-type lectin S-receptor-like serine/threonine-protein kinase At5g35370 n=1 Tax=Tarenaya hassleriana TaxID=28532 RepID=UPI00053C24D7|nr:PREDICTED: G-type lectin S-receptor-like serine/threonine-protein kinase At5g35370 [Tarenaya hassleriana]